MGHAHGVPLLVTLLTEDPHKFLGVPNQERHLSVDKEVPSCFSSYELVI